MYDNNSNLNKYILIEHIFDNFFNEISYLSNKIPYYNTMHHTSYKSWNLFLQWF